MKKKDVFLHATVFIAILGLGSIFGCPIYQIFGVPCPCCGLTRAWLSFLSGDIKSAFSYHPFFIFITAILILGIFEDTIFKSKKLRKIFFGISGIIIFLLYLVRISRG